ncbi:hypothetical protein ACHAWF_016697 [Thalassiosira exigua]
MQGRMHHFLPVGVAIFSIVVVVIKALSTFEGGPQDGTRPIPKEALPIYQTLELDPLVRFVSYFLPIFFPVSTITKCPTLIQQENGPEAEAAILCMNPVRQSLVKADTVDLTSFDIETNLVSRPEGGSPLKVNVFRKKNSLKSSKAPLILYLHGGGFTVRGSPLTLGLSLFSKLLDLDGDDSHFMEGASWATVYYRLAPENTYPAATEDSVLALNHLVREMGLGGGGIHIMGTSAGGTLAMETTLKNINLVDTFFVDEPIVPLPTSQGRNQWSLDSPSFRRYSYSRQVPVTWLEWSLKAYTGMKTVDNEKDLYLGTITTSIDITGGTMNASQWVKRSGSTPLPKLILVTAKGDPLQDGGLAFKDVYEHATEAVGENKIKHFGTNSGHVGFYFFEHTVFQDIVKEWYGDIRHVWKTKSGVNV